MAKPSHGNKPRSDSSGLQTPRDDELGASESSIGQQIRLNHDQTTAQVGRYSVQKVLGRGGMGVVYDVLDPNDGEHYALKTIEVRFLELRDVAAEKRFQQEILVLKRLAHPGIIRMFDSGVARHPMGYNVAYYVMEKLDGETLDPQIRDQTTVDPERALEIAEKIADALAYLEQEGVHHRDIKPANLFETHDHRVVLMDFGLARSDEFTRLTLTGQIVGTFSYMSPERLCAQQTDVLSDVYALGVVLFQLLTGAHPYGSGSPKEMMQAIKRGIKWPDDSALGGPWGTSLRLLLTEMLAPFRGTRPIPEDVAKRCAEIRKRIVEERARPRSATLLIRHAASRARPPTWRATIALAAASSTLAFALGVFVANRPRPKASVAATDLPSPAPSPNPEPPTTVRPTAPRFDSHAAAYAYGKDKINEDPDLAIDALQQALKLNPAFANAHQLLGDALRATGRRQEAAKNYKKYLMFKPLASDKKKVEAKLEAVLR